jgi:hypothetical protein
LEGDRERAEEEIEQQEGAAKEFEEQAAQMTYMANLIALRVQSGRIAAAKGSTGASNAVDGSDETDNLDADAQEALQNLLKEADAVRQASAPENTVASDVDSILYKKLAQEMANKRKRSGIVSNILKPALKGTQSEAEAAGPASTTTKAGAEISQGHVEPNADGSEGGDNEEESGSENSDEGESSSSESGYSSDDEAAPPKKAKYAPLNFLDWTARSI